jgi:DNA polymerase-3 subunit alpha
VTTFAPLHLHTQFSFLDGVPKVEPLVDRIIELGMEACAVTDHGECASHIKFQAACQAKDVKPIFGMEGYFCDDRFDRRSAKAKEEMGDPASGIGYEHITLLATNLTGLHNLWRLSSLAYIEGTYRRPRIDWELLERYREGIIATGGCMAGAVATFFVEGSEKYDEEKGRARLARFLDILGENFYLELITLQKAEQHAVNNKLVGLASDFGAKLIATTDSHYLRPEDWDDHEMLFAAQTRKKYDDPGRYQYGPGQLHVMAEEEVRSRLASHIPLEVVDESIANVKSIVDQCDVKIEPDRSMPVFFDDARTDKRKLMDLAFERFDIRMKKMGIVEGTAKWIEYRRRLLDELELILQKGFAGYFLIVEAMVTWSKSQGMLIGPTRGSVGGSLLAFVLGITEIDPVRAGLMFGRFLDPGRQSLPDIDIDFPKGVGDHPGGRDRVRKWLQRRYQVANVGNFISLEAKAVLRDFAKVLRIYEDEIKQMSQIVARVPDLGVSGFDTTWERIVESVGPDLAPWLEKYPRLFELMRVFKDHVRHPSAHAAGLVLSKGEMIGRIPLRVSADESKKPPEEQEWRTQFDYKDTEYLGFVKFDALQIRNLTTIMYAMALISKRLRGDFTPPRGWVAILVNSLIEMDKAPRRRALAVDSDEEDVIWENMPFAHPYDWVYEWETYYENDDVFRSLWPGHNIGVFQLDTSGGFRDAVRRHKPETVQELADLVSVFRPGITRAVDPNTGMGLLDMFFAKKAGEIPVTFKHPLLEPVLKNTYGQFVYQEQIMKACGVLAGYDLIEQDRVRSILGKMKRDAMKQEREEFTRRCLERDIPQKTVDSIWGDMETFGTYSFNQAHGYGYAVLAYWTAWFKYHYPKEYLAALFMTNEKNSALYTKEARRLDTEVLGPDVHESDASFALTEQGTIRYGIHKVKYVGIAAEWVEELRPYVSLQDLFERTDGAPVTKRVMESLILVGAIDSLVTDEDRKKVLETLGDQWADRLNDSLVVARLYHEWRARPRLLKRGGFGAPMNKDWGCKEHGRMHADLDGQIDCTEQHSATDNDPRDWSDSLSWWEQWVMYSLRKAPKKEVKTRKGHREPVEYISILDRASCEEELLGMVVTVDPFKPYIRLMLANDDYPGVDEMVEGERRRLAGIVRRIRPTTYKVGKQKGATMCQFWVERPPQAVPDDDQFFEEEEQIACFHEEYVRYQDVIEVGAPVMVKVQCSIKEGRRGIFTKQLIRLDKLPD